MMSNTYGHENTVQIHGLPSGFHPAEDLCQAPHVPDAQDVDAILIAERLDQGEVDLEGNILFVLLVCGQETQHHVVWIPKGSKNK